jgi:hypothetical protein
MRRLAPGGALALIAVLTIAAPAAALKLKPLAEYGDRYVTFQIAESGKKILGFQGDCTASKSWAYSFDVFSEIPINARGKFKWSKPNAVNTPDGGTLETESKVTIEGEFLSKSRAKGTYQLHKGGCRPVKFTAKLE